MTKLYVLSEYVSDIVNDRDQKFDLYLCKGKTTIKGPTLIVPTMKIGVKGRCNDLKFEVDPDMYSELFGVDPATTITDEINFYINDVQCNNGTELFKDDVYWAKGVTRNELLRNIRYGCEDFINKEFGFGFVIDENNSEIDVFHREEWGMLNIRLNITIDEDVLRSMVKCKPEKFVTALYEVTESDRDSVILFCE